MISEFKIRLVNDTIDKNDIDKLIEWLHTNPRLTKGDLTVQYEKKWSEWQDRKYSVFVNSGSSANLAMIYSLILSKRLKNNKIIVPAISWVTTVSPLIQLGLEPIMCDCDKETLGLDIEHLNTLVKEFNPSAILLVHVLGFPNKMHEIETICSKHNIILLEDCCEAIGSTYDNIKVGNFGLMSSFSTYFGHHISTIEGGIITTDDEELYHLLLSIRSHGWDRDLPIEKQKQLRNKYNISDFRAFYTFYYPGFNLRSTDLQAFLGMGQLDKLNNVVKRRNENYKRYHDQIKNPFWEIKEFDNTFISNFAYPVITKKLDKLVEELTKGEVEIRPLVCGSIAKQPFWVEKYGNSYLPFASIVHDFGLYLPNNQDLTEEEITYVCDIVNKNL